ncbi:uncharacterized protein SEPMUDRAFT_151183 [Sphaerulina musiva SO2202]|uniref:Uncharacterized protein n=1 Tax=Sphaerulina musiva (strain SO2202) TaxID=692275 RepID=M3BU24_SPHMS|nr:uncharacterized protein SEPMUDRAFT_151183 [Sphaerulina musiva SO2202]EMF10165.1 hypothetical protein SEPMUDRAFT_151183 [Sphaerulina musiva SO2202]
MLPSVKNYQSVFARVVRSSLTPSHLMSLTDLGSEGKVFETVGRTAMRPPSAAGDCPLHPHDDLVKDHIYAMCIHPPEGSMSSAGVEVKTGRQAFEILRKTARRQETE